MILSIFPGITGGSQRGEKDASAKPRMNVSSAPLNVILPGGPVDPTVGYTGCFLWETVCSTTAPVSAEKKTFNIFQCAKLEIHIDS